jgi:small subunit ribosomal protein S1
MEMSVTADTNRLDEVKTKMHFTGKVLKTSLAGALIDIGTSTPAVIHISQLVPPAEGQAIKRVEDVIQIGQEIEVWVRKIKDNRVELTMFKPLDLDWRDIKKEMVVKGTIVRLEKFGAFVEIGAERPGLIHISELTHGYVHTPSEVVKEGDEVDAMVLEVNRRKKQIKLSLKALQPEPVKEEEPVRVADAPRKEKPARRKKTVRKGEETFDENSELVVKLNEEPPAEAEPTYMEIALREAMEKAKTRKKQAEEKARKAKGTPKEQEDLLQRTLVHKAPTA